MARPVIRTRPITVTAPFEPVQPVPSQLSTTLTPPPDPYSVNVNAQQAQVEPIRSALANALVGLALRSYQPAAPARAQRPFEFPPAPEQQPLTPSAFTGAAMPELRRSFTAPQPPPPQGQPLSLPEPPDVPAMPASAGSAMQRLAGKITPPARPLLPSPPAAPAAPVPQAAAAPKPKKAADPFQTLGDPNSRIAFVIPHGDETTAQEVLHEHLKAGNPGYGLVSTSKTRGMGKVSNPNAVFADDNPIRARYDADLFGPNRDIVIGLHNTRGGALKVEQDRSDQMSLADKGYGGYILTTSPEMYELLRKSPYNVILQSKTTPANDDHSMSRYAAMQGKPYVNVEAQRGDKQKQQAMLKLVMQAHQKLMAAKTTPGAKANP